MYKDNSKNKTSMENSSPPCQTYTPTSFRNTNLKLDLHMGGKWFIHGPNHHKEN